MGTRSIVAARIGDQIRGVYVHWDGYPEGRLPVLRALIERDGVGQVVDTILGKPSGWSSLSNHQSTELDAFLCDGRFLAIEGYGVQYNDEPVQIRGESVVQADADYWVPEDHSTDDIWIEYIYIINQDGSVDWAASPAAAAFDDLAWQSDAGPAR